MFLINNTTLFNISERIFERQTSEKKGRKFHNYALAGRKKNYRLGSKIPRKFPTVLNMDFVSV